MPNQNKTKTLNGGSVKALPTATATPQLTISERLENAARIAFRVSLFRRLTDGETLALGDSRIYLNGENIEEREITQADLEKIMPAYERWLAKQVGR